MKKILLSINNHNIEHILMNMVHEEDVSFAVQTHKEAVLSYLKENQADVIVLNEDLPGEMPILTLIEGIQSISPKAKIIFITQERTGDDFFLEKVKALDVYKTISKNAVSVNEIVDCIEDAEALS